MMVVIQDGLSGNGMSIVFTVVFITLLIYLLLTIVMGNKEKRKLEKARDLIEEGHQKILNGTTDDGYYRESVERNPNTQTSIPEYGRKPEARSDLVKEDDYVEWSKYWSHNSK